MRLNAYHPAFVSGMDNVSKSSQVTSSKDENGGEASTIWGGAVDHYPGNWVEQL